MVHARRTSGSACFLLVFFQVCGLADLHDRASGARDLGPDWLRRRGALDLAG